MRRLWGEEGHSPGQGSSYRQTGHLNLDAHTCQGKPGLAGRGVQSEAGPSLRGSIVGSRKRAWGEGNGRTQAPGGCTGMGPWLISHVPACDLRNTKAEVCCL